MLGGFNLEVQHPLRMICHQISLSVSPIWGSFQIFGSVILYSFSLFSLWPLPNDSLLARLTDQTVTILVNPRCQEEYRWARQQSHTNALATCSWCANSFPRSEKWSGYYPYQDQIAPLWRLPLSLLSCSLFSSSPQICFSFPQYTIVTKTGWQFLPITVSISLVFN